MHDKSRKKASVPGMLIRGRRDSLDIVIQVRDVSYAGEDQKKLPPLGGQHATSCRQASRHLFEALPKNDQRHRLQIHSSSWPKRLMNERTPPDGFTTPCGTLAAYSEKLEMTIINSPDWNRPARLPWRPARRAQRLAFFFTMCYRLRISPIFHLAKRVCGGRRACQNVPAQRTNGRRLIATEGHVRAAREASRPTEECLRRG